ncbi:MAG: glycyl-radical enzyme activating protein [Thermoleophilia bacterium]
MTQCPPRTPPTTGADSVGVVFDIQHFSIHDGPGIRTTVFLKGCPLACVWCQNPESQAWAPEIMFHADRCVGCGRCVEVCPNGAIEVIEGRARTDRSACADASLCVEACPHDARTLVGNTMRARDVVERVAADSMFYERSGGGVTLSGGEPLAQPGFAEAILRLCKEAGLHTAVDTCGHAEWATVRSVLRHADLVLYDLKHMDPEEHRKLTGASNSVILANARRIRQELGLPVLARVPLIPGYNDSTANLEATARFIAGVLGMDTPVHLHPYHRFGEGKYEGLERTTQRPLLEQLTDDQTQAAAAVLERYGLRVAIGG